MAARKRTPAATAKKAGAKKAAAKKSPAAKKAPVTKRATRTTAAQRAAARKAASRRAAAVKKAPAAKKAPARKRAPARQQASAVQRALDTARSVLSAVAAAPARLAEKVARPLPSTRPVGVKMRLQPGMTATVLGAPRDPAAMLGALPDGVHVTDTLGHGTPEFVLAFVRNQAELVERMDQLGPWVKPRSLLWVAYPKQSSGVETDLTRDRGWESATAHGLEVVAQVAVDDTWAASRLVKRE